MPTARPSISARVGELLDTVTRLATSTTALSVTPTPISEVRIGMPAASSEPNVMARITNEIASPISSGSLLGSAVVL